MSTKRKTQMSSLGIHKEQKDKFEDIMKNMRIVENLPFEINNIQAFELLLDTYNAKILKFNQK